MEEQKKDNKIFWQVIRPKKEDKVTGEDYVIVKCTINHSPEHSETYSKLFSTNYFKKILGVQQWFLTRVKNKSLMVFAKEELVTNQLSPCSIPNFERKEDNSFQISLLTDFNKRGEL